MNETNATLSDTGDTFNTIKLQELEEELRQTKEKLKETEEALQFIQLSLESTSDAVVWVNLENGRYHAVNQELCRRSGYSKTEILGMHVYDLMPGMTREMWMTGINKVDRVGHGIFEDKMRTKNNQLLPVEIQVTHITFKDKKYGFAISRDITRRKKLEKENLQTIIAQQEALLNNIPHIAWMKDAESRYIAVNEAYANFCKRERESMVNLTDFDLWPKTLAEKFREEDQKLLESGLKVHSEEFIEDSQGNGFWYEVFKAPINHDPASRMIAGSVGIALDITARKAAEEALRSAKASLERELVERKLLEEQLVQTQKMRAIGQLASGVAHDFNSLLTVMIGRLQLLKAHVSDETGCHMLQAAQHAAERAAKLTKQLLAFARMQPLYPTMTHLNALIQEMDSLLQNSLSDNVVLEEALAKDLWPILADTTQIQLAILNLVLNACDAMPNGGKLLIRTQNAVLKTPVSELEPGDYVSLSVSDNGAGMSEDVLSHAIEPFFTTKGIGKGTGLGLSQVYGIVKQLGGMLQLNSELNQGTTVEIFLPRMSVK